MDMDISMDIHAKSVDMDMDMDVKFHIHSNPDTHTDELTRTSSSKYGCTANRMGDMKKTGKCRSTSHGQCR